MSRVRFHIVAAAAAILLAAPALVSAQSDWLRSGNEGWVGLEFSHPNLEGGGISALSSGIFLSLDYPINDRLMFRGELPVAYGDVDGPFGGSATEFGNPYLGVAYAPVGSSFSVEGGVRLPVLGDDSDINATLVGYLSDLDRWEAFIDEVTTVVLIGRYQGVTESGLHTRVRLGTNMLTEDGEQAWHMLYGGELGYEVRDFYLGGGVSGRWWMDAEDGFGQADWHQAELRGSYEKGRFRPMIQFRLPLDDEQREIIDYTLSLGVQMQVR